MTGGDALASRLADVRRRIAQACQRSGRDAGEVLLVGATKGAAVDRLAAAADAGLTDFGENYARELEEKARAVATLTEPRRVIWHFIGTLQTGTASKVADVADVVHSAVPDRALERLGRRRLEAGRPRLDVLLQVDFTGRRHGVTPDDVGAAAERVAAVGGIHLVGLMTLPPFTEDPAAARPYFAQLRGLRDHVRRRLPDAVHLSMGMSRDYSVAVEEGATMVRVGTALFGERARR